MDLRVTLFRLATAYAVVVPAYGFAQAPPPGSGNWTIEYKGQILTSSGWGGWNQPNWGTSAPTAYASGTAALGRLYGTINARLRWINTTYQPPTVVNVLVNSSCGGQASGFVVANNGFESRNGSGGAGSSGKYLVQRQGAASVEFTYTIDTTASPQGGAPTIPYSLSSGYSLSLDPRFALIGIAGVGVHYKRVANGRSPMVQRMFNGIPCGSADYDMFRPEPVRPGPASTQTEYEVDYGLQLGASLSSYISDPVSGIGFWHTTETRPRTTSLTYLADVYQKLIPVERYQFNSTLSASSDGGTLPTLAGWDISGLNCQYQNPSIDTAVSFGIPNVVTFGAVQTGQFENVRLKYTWNDGVVANSKLKVTFHQPLETNQRWGDPNPRVTDAGAPWEQVPLKGGFAPLDSAAGWDYAQSGSEIAYKLLSNSLTIIGAIPGLNDWVGFACALAQIGIDNGGVAPEYRTFPCGTVTAENLDWGSELPWTGSLPSANDCEWTAATKPDYFVAFYMLDNWNASGYVGQVASTIANNLRHSGRSTCKYSFVYKRENGQGNQLP